MTLLPRHLTCGMTGCQTAAAQGPYRQYPGYIGLLVLGLIHWRTTAELGVQWAAAVKLQLCRAPTRVNYLQLHVGSTMVFTIWRSEAA
jgi:hypothetical protein